MKRLLAYLFIVLGLGLVVSVNVLATRHLAPGPTYCVNKTIEKTISNFKKEYAYDSAKKLTLFYIGGAGGSCSKNKKKVSRKKFHELKDQFYEKVSQFKLTKAEPSQTQEVAKKDAKITIKKKKDAKITIEEIKDMALFDRSEIRYRDIQFHLFWEEKFKKLKKSETLEKRIQTRAIAICMYKNLLKDKYIDSLVDMSLGSKQCHAQLIRVIFSRTEKNQKRRPGDIFYALEAIEQLVFVKNMNLSKINTLKKIEKFKKDPSNEKVLGSKLIKHIKNVRMTRGIREKIGNVNYALLGDMLNAVVTDVKKNNISPDLQKRRALLKKYSLILRGIKKKLDEDKYKSIDKDVSKLSKTYKDLKALTSTTNEMVMNIDEAVDNIFDTNKLIQKSVLNSKDNEEEKLLALSSIYFMDSLIDSILSVIPEKYYAETKELSRDLFNDDDLIELEVIIDVMTNKNKEIKSAELTKSMDIINNYINTSEVLKTLDNLGMKNSISRPLTQDIAAKIVNQQIRDNLDKEVLKEASKILEKIDKTELSEITKEVSAVAKEVSAVAKEVSDIASEIASDPSVKDAVSNRAVDREYGGQNLKKLIGVARR